MQPDHRGSRIALVPTNREIAQALNAAGYSDAMEEAFRAYGAGAAMIVTSASRCR
jgi:hypothetical protein